MPAQSSRYDDQDPPISQGSQIWGEGPEIVPYAAGFKPLYPQSMVPGYNGYNAPSSSVSGSTTPSASQVPDPYDLTWVASDTAQFAFFFKNVCWTDVVPVPAPTLYGWTKTVWCAQVRTTWGYYYNYWWPPVFPLGGYVMAFNVTAQYMGDPTPDPVLGTGTLVSLTGGTFWPGKFKWDLQADTYADVANPDTLTSVRTWLSGNATVLSQVTSPQIYPPSNWPMYAAAAQ